jgi:hypothetical protein
MRWHPMVIKLCLSNYTSERNYEQLRNSGFLKLPSGRLLRNYRQLQSTQKHFGLSNFLFISENPLFKQDNICLKSSSSLLESRSLSYQEQNDQPPIMKKYKCNWEKCTAGHFDKEDSLKNHVKKHTGEEKDIFLKLLLIDQAKALDCLSKTIFASNHHHHFWKVDHFLQIYF